MAGNRVKIIDHGWNKIKLMAAKLKKGQAISVGVQGSEAEESRADNTAWTNVKNAAVHEWGRQDGSIKERSFLRSTFDENQKDYQRELDRIGKSAFKEGTVEGNLLLLGEKYKLDILNKMKSGIAPELADSTKARRIGGTTPLIDTKQLMMSLTAVITNEPAVKRVTK